jgi:hypothetical protein
MKKQFLGIGFLISFSVFAQAQTNTFPASGNVGIGTISPLATLHVNGQVIFQGANVGIQFRDVSNSNNFQMGLVTSAGGYSRFSQPGDFVFGKVNVPGNIYISNQQNGTINFTTGPNATTDNIIMTINGSNVGIGSTTPTSKLEVAGKIRSIGAGSASGSFEAANVQNGNTYFTTNTTSGNGYINLNKLDGTTTVFLNSLGQSYFNGGNVLIGKTSQTNIGYKLDINGDARANKLVVNTTGADFVFDSTYSLPTLQQVEAYIQQHHHLPQIASATEMQKNGIDLGDNQTRLLQKTEELTLYIIQQDKIIIEQNAQLQSLESKMAGLEQKLELLENKLNQ